MARLIKIQEIDQFVEILSIPENAISDEILENVRQLDEKQELEPAIKQILYDPNETPHGPTEIADIVTTKVVLRGEKRIAAFVLKGKSFQRLTSREVTHQFVKLRQIPDLGLAVLLAVGDIQDDAQRDFITICLDAACDFLIVDSVDCARLLLAYEKICPIDGTYYDNKGICKRGHLQDDGIKLEFRVKEDIEYEVPNLRDVSHGGAKRYTAVVLVDRHYSGDVLRKIAIAATEEIKQSNYHRSNRLGKFWADSNAHVVWLYFAGDLGDVRQANWICRTEWIDENLPKDMRPSRMKPEEVIDGISIAWNESYQAMKEFNQEHTGSKGEILSLIEPMLQQAIDIFNKIVKHHECHDSGGISEDNLIGTMQELCPQLESIYMKAGDIPLPPDDLKDYDEVAQSIFALIDNICIYYSQDGLKSWPAKNRKILVKMAIEDINKDLKRLEYEKEKIHK